MKQQVEQFLSTIAAPVQEEIASLLGTEFTLATGEGKVVTRTDLAGLMPGRSITSLLAIAGEVDGVAGVITGAKAAIRMGGSLLMLPETELEESISREDVSEEIRESFGEIAGVVAGILTSTFTASPDCEFSRRETLVWSAKNLGEGEPLEGDSFYIVSFAMSLAGVEAGSLIVALPAVPFGFTDVDSTADAAETAEDDPIAATPAAVDYDPEENQQRINELLTDCQTQLSEEVGSLLGNTVTFSGLETFLVERDEFFNAHLQGRQIFADMDLVTAEGSLGQGWFIVSIGAAIRLGGVLVMLPDSELERSAEEEDFYEDLADAYGEVANIVSGVYTRIFETRCRLKNRFVKKGLKEIVPLKDSEQIENLQYYCTSMNVEMPEHPMGKVYLLLPALAMQVAAPPAEPEAQEVEEVIDYPMGEELITHQMRVDALLEECRKRSQNEISDLCGVKVQLENLSNEVVQKDEFLLKRLSGRQVLAHMDIVGEVDGRAYLVTSLVDSIYMGGVLVMLPPPELEAAVEKEEFNEDVADAWGEIANIIAGAYTSNFEEQYKYQLRFVRKEIEELIPAGVDLAADEPMPPGEYYLSSMLLNIDGREMGRVNMLVPLAMLELQGLVTTKKQEEEAARKEKEGWQTESDTAVADSLGSDAATAAAVEILLVGDDEKSAAQMAALLEKRGLQVRTLSLKDEVLNYIGDSLQAVWLVMSEVNEQAFGTAIKISSRSSTPIIAAGPAWTRSKVIQAVKYGVEDILILPATDAELEESFNKHLS